MKNIEIKEGDIIRFNDPYCKKNWLEKIFTKKENFEICSHHNQGRIKTSYSMKHNDIFKVVLHAHRHLLVIPITVSIPNEEFNVDYEYIEYFDICGSVH